MKNEEKRSLVFEAIAQYIEFKAAFENAKNSGDEEVARAIRLEWASHRDYLNELAAEVPGFGFIYEGLLSAQKVGNETIDICEPLHGYPAEDIIGWFREYGIEKFTMSSTWSSAVEVAWDFVNAGAKLVGMTEINSRIQEFMSEEYQVVPAFVFEVQ